MTTKESQGIVICYCSTDYADYAEMRDQKKAREWLFVIGYLLFVEIRGNKRKPGKNGYLLFVISGNS